MQNLARQQQLADLRERIATIEKRPPLADGPGGPGSDRNEDFPQALLRPPAGLLHEVYADAQRNGGAALGFALGLARDLLTPARPAVLFLQLIHAAQDVGLPYGPGLKSFGFDPDRLIIARLSSPADLLWAIEEAIACRAVAAVVAEILGEPRALDFTASRRLSLRAASGGTSVFLMRYGIDREASAARLRWCISPAASRAPPFDDRAPGQAQWHVVLEKGRLRASLMQAGLELWLDWTEHGFIPAAEPAEEGRRRHGAAAAVHGAPFAALGDRVSQAG